MAGGDEEPRLPRGTILLALVGILCTSCALFRPRVSRQEALTALWQEQVECLERFKTEPDKQKECNQRYRKAFLSWGARAGEGASQEPGD